MERAAELLAARGLTVREVAQRVGYRQPAQFAKAFRRHHGVAPSAYRAARASRGSAPRPTAPRAAACSAPARRAPRRLGRAVDAALPSVARRP